MLRASICSYRRNLRLKQLLTICARMCCLDVQLLATMIAGFGCGTLAPPRRQ